MTETELNTWVRDYEDGTGLIIFRTNGILDEFVKALHGRLKDEIKQMLPQVERYK